MKRYLLIVLGIIIFGAFSVSAVNTDISTFEINVFGPPEPIIRIQVPDSIFFGNVSKGKESDRPKIDINNTENVDVIVKPQLLNNSETIFSYTYFSELAAGPFIRIGDFSMIINASSTGVRKELMYAKVDLTNFNGDIKSDIPGHKADVRFFAVAA